MKYRIVQTEPYRYIVQKKFLFFWVRILRNYLTFFSYEDARNALLTHRTFKKRIFDGDEIFKQAKENEKIAQEYCSNPFKDMVTPDLLHPPVKCKEMYVNGEKVK